MIHVIVQFEDGRIVCMFVTFSTIQAVLILIVDSFSVDKT